MREQRRTGLTAADGSPCTPGRTYRGRRGPRRVARAWPAAPTLARDRPRARGALPPPRPARPRAAQPAAAPRRRARRPRRARPRRAQTRGRALRRPGARRRRAARGALGPSSSRASSSPSRTSRRSAPTRGRSPTTTTSSPTTPPAAPCRSGRLLPAGRDRTGAASPRVVVYRRPLEARAADRLDLADLVHDVVVDQVARLLGLDPDEVDGGAPRRERPGGRLPAQTAGA